MSAAERPLVLPRAPSPVLTALKRMVASSRFWVYVSCTVLAVLTNYHLGKEMLWDTMDYHVYAGFSALHDRFHRDYFAAGPQGYFNPYAYVPFYLLLRSSLTPLEDASILAALQSAILWLTYELALLVTPCDQPRGGLTAGLLAVAFAFANPVLINEFGSSYADITTAEIALAGWLVLLGAVRAPARRRILCAGLLLGSASALKLTNSVHALSAAALLPFISGGWRIKLRHAGLYAGGVVAAFLLVSAPWSLRLEQYFGNPLFPLLNGVFRSPQFTTAPILDYRFIPVSLRAALLRPFAISTSAPMVHFELPAPDIRYAVLYALLPLVLARQVWRRLRRPKGIKLSPEEALETRALQALGCGFVLDWTLWLAASGNSRYFIPMACVAAALGVGLVFRLLADKPNARNCLLVAVIGLQCFALYAGTDYRARLPWAGRRWFSLSVPSRLASQPSLYFMLGIQSNSFIIPDLPAGSGFINLEGAYVLGPNGANGARVEALVTRYAPHLRVLVRDLRPETGRKAGLPDPEQVDDALEPFGLEAVAGRCSTIVARGVTIASSVGVVDGSARRPKMPENHAENLVTCAVERTGLPVGAPYQGQLGADRALDHLEDACPALFQPPRPVDVVMGDRARGYLFSRRYSDTGTVAWVARGWVEFERRLGGQEQVAGSEKMWEDAPPLVSCGRQGPGHFKIGGHDREARATASTNFLR